MQGLFFVILVFCFFFFYFCFVFAILFFPVHQIVNASLEFWVFAGQSQPGVLLFMQMFTRLKLNLDFLWSSVFLYPSRLSPGGLEVVVLDRGVTSKLEIAHVRAVFPPVFYFFFFYNVREILEELLILCFIEMYLKCGEI